MAKTVMCMGNPLSKSSKQLPFSFLKSIFGKSALFPTALKTLFSGHFLMFSFSVFGRERNSLVNLAVFLGENRTTKERKDKESYAC